MAPNRLLALIPALILSACGGGGETPIPTSSSADRPVQAVAPALTFTPATLAASVVEGQTTSMAVQAVLTRPTDFPAGAQFFVRVLEQGNVISGMATTPLSGSSFSATLNTSAALSEGRHTGNLTVQLCSDQNCERQYAGSPMALPYQIDVSARQLYVERASNGQFTYAINGAAVVPDQIRVVGPGRGWTLQSNSTWLKPSVSSGAGTMLVNIAVDPTGLAPADYKGELAFRTQDGQHTTLLYTLRVQ
jgi:hypothetical protein